MSAKRSRDADTDIAADRSVKTARTVATLRTQAGAAAGKSRTARLARADRVFVPIARTPRAQTECTDQLSTPVAAYCPPTTRWLAAHGDAVPCITHHMALVVCRDCTPFARENAYVETLRRLLEYREECGLVNMLYSYTPYRGTCAVTYVSVVAVRREWLFGYAARGKLTLREGPDGRLLDEVVLPLDPMCGSESEDVGMEELLSPVAQCAIVAGSYIDAQTAVRDWIDETARRRAKYTRFSALVSDKTPLADARAVYVKLFGTKDDENSDKEESSDNDD